MTNLIKILKSFNRKERFFLIAHALGLHSNSGEPAFSLSNCFREQLNTKFDLKIPQDSEDVFVAMDYHLDWLQAALILAHTSQGEKSKFCNQGKEGQVITGTQEDVDLLVAFQVSGTFHLILVEAKGTSVGIRANCRPKLTGSGKSLAIWEIDGLTCSPTSVQSALKSLEG